MIDRRNSSLKLDTVIRYATATQVTK